jgi:HicB family
MPKTLHAELAARSDADGVSLNQYIVSALARAVSGEAPPPAPDEGRDRSIRAALVVNAVVVAIAAATAIVILIVAIR